MNNNFNKTTHYEKPSPQDYLAHHGILGMKWGVRRFQNKDGSLTPAGRKRYNVDVEGAKQKLADAQKAEQEAARDYNKDTKGGLIADKEAKKRLDNAGLNTRLAKIDLSREKAKEAMNKGTREKSKHRSNLESEYKKRGFTQEEAEIAAYKRERTEKILAAIAGVAVAALAGYAAYKHHDKTVDKLIKPGTLLQNISRDNTMGVRDAFYSSMTELDNAKYRGIFGQSIASAGNRVFEKKINVNQALKVASESNAAKALSDLVKNDPSYAKTLEEHLRNSVGRYSSTVQNNVMQKGFDSLKSGKIDANVYRALNLSLTDHGLKTSDPVHKGFYNKLKSLGYDAIMDVNDKKYSGYKSSNPLVVFNNAKTAVQSVREVGESEIRKAAAKGYMDINVKNLAPSVAKNIGAFGLVVAGMNALQTRSDNEIVRRYRAEHPNSELSYTDILRNEKSK